MHEIQTRKKTGLRSFAIVCVIVSLISFWGGVRYSARQAPATDIRVDGYGNPPPEGVIGRTTDVAFREFWDLWQLMKEKYYKQPIKDRSLFYGAMAGLAASAGDPYTTFFEPKTAQDFQESLNGKFEGIGAEIGLKNGRLQIVAPLPGMPAEKAGLIAGDNIMKINGVETDGMTVEQAVMKIRGPRGTKVKLTILRPSQKKAPFDVEITRNQIQIKSVRTRMLEQRIAFVEVTHFNADTEDGFNDAVNWVLKQDTKGLIVDFRNNPGGFLDTALKIAGEWIGDSIVVKERRQGKIMEELHGTGKKRLDGIPTVVLVNQGSASASEIVAGALQDAGKAKILGMKTFGKGSVQDYQTFEDGSGVKITVAEWLTPKERTINETGLDPDIIVDRTPEDYEAGRDPQLDRAIKILTGASQESFARTTSTSTDR